MVGEDANCWISDGRNPAGDWLRLYFASPVTPKEVRLTFESDLSCEIMPSLSKWIQDRQPKRITDELITDYRLVYRLEGKEVGSETVAGNHLRQRVHSAGGVICDEIRVEIPPVNRCTACRIYEIRVYA